MSACEVVRRCAGNIAPYLVQISFAKNRSFSLVRATLPVRQWLTLLSRFPARTNMSMQKLFRGVLRVQTPAGCRYFRPPLRDRVTLVWIFRHFASLPLQVLTEPQRQLLSRICMPSLAIDNAQALRPVLGTVEVRSWAALFSGRKPPVGETLVEEHKAISA